MYLSPFEWIIAYNLGLVHLNTAQFYYVRLSMSFVSNTIRTPLRCRYASAFHYFSASINLKRDFASAYMYLAITLSRLDDFENACHAYEKAIEMERCDLSNLSFSTSFVFS